MWESRLQRVNELIEYVTKQLPHIPQKIRRQKAGQYVYSNLMVGKMFDPDGDPLLSQTIYEDHSLRQIIGDLSYNVFCEMRNQPLIKTRKTEKDEVILRYQCIGGFDNGLHASITPNLAEYLKDFTECFASPINHKLSNYFSMFEEDALYGSNGNFFKFVETNPLPSGKYYMNPPWIEAFLSKIALIIDKASKESTILILAPLWKDAEFIQELNHAGKEFKFVINGVTKLNYIVDGSEQNLTLPTIYWVMSDKLIPHDILKIFS